MKIKVSAVMSLFKNNTVASLTISLLVMQFSAKVFAQFSYPGGVAEILLPKTTPQPPLVRYGLKEPAVIETERNWRVLVGIALDQLPGDYVVYSRQTDTDEAAVFTEFQVEHKQYVAIPLTSKDLLTLDSVPLLQDYSELDFHNTQPPRLPMQLPIDGDWNKNFGRIAYSDRISDGGNTEERLQNHSFIVSSPLTLIRAPQAGIVSKLITTEAGLSTLVIDHGSGVQSVLHGLSDITVELGNGVTAGAVLAKVPRLDNDQTKNTSTLSHIVYWQVRMNGVFVDPLLMTKL